MGTLDGRNGGGSWPPDGGPPDDLPDVPSEWGDFAIPDDAHELDKEAAKIRREIRRERRQITWRRRLHLRPPSRRRFGEDDNPTIGVPLLIVSIAVLATLASLFAVAWPGRTRVPVPSGERSPGQATPTQRLVLPDVFVLGSGGGPLKLRDTLPAAVLLVDGCACAELTDATSAAAGPVGVGVVVIGRTAAPSPLTTVPPKSPLWGASDPQNVLWSAIPGLPADAGRQSATVLLVNSVGVVLRLVPATTSAQDFAGDLSSLKS